MVSPSACFREGGLTRWRCRLCTFSVSGSFQFSASRQRANQRIPGFQRTFGFIFTPTIGPHFLSFHYSFSLNKSDISNFLTCKYVKLIFTKIPFSFVVNWYATTGKAYMQKKKKSFHYTFAQFELLFGGGDAVIRQQEAAQKSCRHPPFNRSFSPRLTSNFASFSF